MAPEIPAENTDIIPDDVRAKLDAARAELDAEAQKEPTGATKLAATNLGEALDTNDRAEVSSRLKQLRNSTDFHRLSEPLRLKLDNLQAEVESTPEKAMRLTQEGANAALQGINKLPTVAKVPLIAALLATGAVITKKTVELVQRILLGTWNVTKDVAQGTKNVARKGLGYLLGGLKIGAAVGVSALAFMGVKSMIEKRQAPSENAEKTA